ncbi:MAG: hypothetical protein HY063_05925 [Bacteroidetes bacterium]|nr:hypothetical protein [Bacteroidota bacterium]
MSAMIKKEIITTPDIYYASIKKALEERIEEIKLPPDEEGKIVADITQKTIRDKVLGLFKIGEIINTVLNWNEKVDSDIKDAKKEILLSVYFDKADKAEESISRIIEFISTPQGNTLFNKLLRILDNTPPDMELMNHLAEALKNIVNTDFCSLFEDHKFALNQIEMLTPQALSILADNKNWPEWKLTGYSSTGDRITSHWLPDFVKMYCAKRNIIDSSIIVKITHSTNELVERRYIEGRLAANKKLVGIAALTDTSRIILRYIL